MGTAILINLPYDQNIERVNAFNFCLLGPEIEACVYVLGRQGLRTKFWWGSLLEISQLEDWEWEYRIKMGNRL
jgi:hypothetical protein